MEGGHAWSHTILEKEPATATTLYDSFLLRICVTVSGWAELTDSYFYNKRKKRWAKMWPNRVSHLGWEHISFECTKNLAIMHAIVGKHLILKSSTLGY